MADIVFLVLTIGFFALMAALVVACDRLIGVEGPETVPAEPDTRREAAATGVAR